MKTLPPLYLGLSPYVFIALFAALFVRCCWDLTANSRAALFEALADEHAQTLEKKGLGRITGVKINIESNEEETAYARKRKYTKP